MCSPGINGEGELRGQPGNPGSPGKPLKWSVCVCVTDSDEALKDDALLCPDVFKDNTEDGSRSHRALARHWEGWQQHKTSDAGHRMSHSLSGLESHHWRREK